MKYCTGFTDTWIKWDGLFKWKVFDLGRLCEKHDEECSTHTFFKLLMDHRVVGGVLIGTVATIACWIKYPRNMKKRL